MRKLHRQGREGSIDRGVGGAGLPTCRIYFLAGWQPAPLKSLSVTRKCSGGMDLRAGSGGQGLGGRGAEGDAEIRGEANEAFPYK